MPFTEKTQKGTNAIDSLNFLSTGPFPEGEPMTSFELMTRFAFILW
jgi:hypothetical protein